MKRIGISAAFAVLLGAAAMAAGPGDGLPAGDYKLDPSHASLIVRVEHMGFSHYTGRFGAFDAQLRLDPADPAKAALTATVQAGSLGLENPPPGFLEEMTGAHWLNAGAHPEMTFVSKQIEMTGPDTAKVVGDFTFNGVTKPVTLDVRFNGGTPGHERDPHARLGFSAAGELKRSEFGVSFGVPEPGSKMGVSDEVEIIIEAEFTGPAWKR